jgi:tRNA (adenine57-N1/adenine58-N1)-methyltransferase catalytic subunit
MPTLPPGELALLISPDRKRFMVRLQVGGELHTHRGVVRHDDILVAAVGGSVFSHNGARFAVLRPSMDEVLMTLPRNSAIVYPKDIGYILLKLSIVPGVTVIEAGSGSGVLTTALARYVTPGGHVHSYDARADMIALASANVERIGLADAVTFHQRSIEAGFLQTDVDALFLDVREPWHFLHQAVDAMAEGAFFGSLVPTINQVVQLVARLHREHFADIELVEILLRSYKTVPDRIRPQDRLTSHTGFLLFARKRVRVARPDADADDADDGEDGRGAAEAGLRAAGPDGDDADSRDTDARDADPRGADAPDGDDDPRAPGDGWARDPFTFGMDLD